MTRIIGDIRSFHLGVTDLERSLAFYRDAWGLTPVASDQGSHYLRAAGREHHVLRLSGSTRPALIGIEFAATDAAALARIAAEARASGLSDRDVAPLPAAGGGGAGIRIASPDGIAIGVSADVARHDDMLPDRTMPVRLTHVVINSADLDTQLGFFIDQLGFRLSDNTDRQYFLRSSIDHHSLAIARGSDSSLNHAAFEMHDFDAQMHASGRVVENGHPIEWGPGRHGPGNNIFCYFVDPDGFGIEYTTEVEQIDETRHAARDAAFWASLPRRPCRWGLAGRPSPRMAEAFSGAGQR